jgi:hypothetical protein
MRWMLHLGCSKIRCPGYLCIDKVGPRDMGLRGRRRWRRPQSWQPLSCLAATILLAFEVEVLDARSMCLSCYQGWWHQIGYSSCNSLGERRRLSLNMNCPIAAAASSSPSLEECCCKSSSYDRHLNYISYIYSVRKKNTHSHTKLGETKWREKPSLGFRVLSYHHAWLFCVSLIDWLIERERDHHLSCWFISFNLKGCKCSLQILTLLLISDMVPDFKSQQTKPLWS